MLKTVLLKRYQVTVSAPSYRAIVSDVWATSLQHAQHYPRDVIATWRSLVGFTGKSREISVNIKPVE